jgi:hypothetical protein
MKRACLIIALLFCLTLPALALDFYFDPDTLQGNLGQQLTLSGRITGSAPLRSFTVYMAYDTNVIDLVPPPVAGALIAGHSGLQFNYFDHAPIHPTLLEITATIFGADLWQGPGELFQLTFELRSCADAPITAPFVPFFLDGVGSVVPVTYFPAIIGVCSRVPRSTSTLVIYPDTGTQVTLRWQAVRLDTLNRPLFALPTYRVLGQSLLPVIGPEVVITITSDTTVTHPIGPTDASWNYRVTTLTP